MPEILAQESYEGIESALPHTLLINNNKIIVTITAILFFQKTTIAKYLQRFTVNFSVLFSVILTDYLYFNI
jgi:hypothetical protein